MTSSDDKTVWQQIHDESAKVLEEQMKRKEHELLQSLRNSEDREPFPEPKICRLEPEDCVAHHAQPCPGAQPGLRKGNFFVAIGDNRKNLPTRYGDCTCDCHVIPMNHVRPCCHPLFQPSPLQTTFSANALDEETDIDLDAAVAIICAWLDEYAKQKLPHVRDVLKYRQIVDLVTKIQESLEEEDE